MKKLLFLLLLTSSTTVFAQKKMLTMQDAMVNNRTSLAPETLRQLQFIKGSNDFAFVKKVNGEDVWVKATVSNIEGNPFLTLAEVNRRARLAGIDTFKALPPVQFNNDNYVLSIKGNKYSFYNSKDSFLILGEAKAVGKEAVDESKAGYAAFVDSFNLYVAKNGVVKQVTYDGNDGLIYGRAVHQQEFGITKGTFWNDAGDKLAFYRMDQSMVPDYPIIEWTKRPAKANFIKYPMAGDSSHHVTVGIYDAVSGSTHYLKTGLPAEQYLTNIAWAPDGKSVYIAVLNREQNHMKFNQYDVASGEFVKTLFEEQQDKYVEPLVPMLFLKNDPSMFIWQSRRDGWNHLYLYNTSGKLVRQLTSGQWEVTAVKNFNTKGDKLYYVSTAVSPISRNLYSVNIKNAKSSGITEGDMNHNVTLSESGDYAIDNFSSTTNPRTIQLINTKSGKKVQLFQAKDPLQNFDLGSMSIFTLKSNDGYDLYARTFKPVNFDSTKKYPVLVYWYGGPHAQLVLNSFNGGAGDYWFQYLAQRGYLVFTIDTRGSANRGRAFEQTIFRKAGTAQMEDMVTGVN
ncbi:MAG: S9 family peptidase, partial [Chitinophagaceae bacterium]